MDEHAEHDEHHRTTIDHTALAVAEARANVWPDERLPCPACAASLKGANLARHLGEKHPGLAPVAPQGPSRFEGVDRRIRRWYWVGAAALLAAFGGLVLRHAGPTGILSEAQQELPAGEQLRLLATSPPGVLLLVGLASLVLVTGAHRLRVFRATVTVDQDELRLRHRVGTGTIRVDLADRAALTVETGTLFERRPLHRGSDGGDGGGGASVEAEVGAYLRLAHGRRAITIGCTNATGLRKHWSGWSGGKRRKVWDVTLPAATYVALQYALADQAVLVAPTAGLPSRGGRG